MVGRYVWAGLLVVICPTTGIKTRVMSDIRAVSEYLDICRIFAWPLTRNGGVSVGALTGALVDNDARAAKQCRHEENVVALAARGNYATAAERHDEMREYI